LPDPKSSSTLSKNYDIVSCSTAGPATCR